jgi:hypothetical protein
VPDPPIPGVLADLLKGKAVSHFIDKSRKAHRKNYRALFESGEMEPLMLHLAQTHIERGFIDQTHRALDIPPETLRFWRKQLRGDPTFRPYSEPANISKRALSFEQEQQVHDRITTDYIDPGRYCPSRVLMIEAIKVSHLAANADEEETEGEEQGQEAQEDSGDGQEEEEEEAQKYSWDGREEEDGEDEEEEEETDPLGRSAVQLRRDDTEFQDSDTGPSTRFVASRHWRRDFMKRWKLSQRKPHAKRRPNIDPAAVQAFQRRMAVVRQRFPPELVINMDETSW